MTFHHSHAVLVTRSNLLSTVQVIGIVLLKKKESRIWKLVRIGKTKSSRWGGQNARPARTNQCFKSRVFARISVFVDVVSIVCHDCRIDCVCVCGCDSHGYDYDCVGWDSRPLSKIVVVYPHTAGGIQCTHCIHPWIILVSFSSFNWTFVHCSRLCLFHGTWQLSVNPYKHPPTLYATYTRLGTILVILSMKASSWGLRKHLQHLPCVIQPHFAWVSQNRRLGSYQWLCTIMLIVQNNFNSNTNASRPATEQCAVDGKMRFSNSPPTAVFCCCGNCDEAGCFLECIAMMDWLVFVCLDR